MSLNNTLRNGQLVNSTNPLQNFVRDWAVWALRFIPRLEYRLQLGPRLEGPVKYSYLPGMPFLPEHNGGVYFLQTYCIELGDRTETVRFSDDILFAKEKTKLFQIVVLLDSVQDLATIICDFHYISSDQFDTKESTVLVPACTKSPSDDFIRHGNSVFRAATAEEFSQSELCSGRSIPRGYDASQMWEMFQSTRYVIVRPDRFVYAAVSTSVELEQAARKLSELFPME